MYTEIAISNGPGTLIVHVVVPGEMDNDESAPTMLDLAVFDNTSMGGEMAIVSEPVSRERFLEWAATA